MSEFSTEQVEVPFEDDAPDKAVLLLEAAQSLDLEPSVVQTTSEGFRVPKEVADKAFGRSEQKQAPAKKAAAKKSTAPKKAQE